MTNPRYLSDDIIDKLWLTLIKKQQEIKRQLEESEKKFYLQMEANNRLMEESEKKFFQKMEAKNRQILENKNSEEESKKEDDEINNTKQRTRNKKTGLMDSSFTKILKEKGWKMHGVIAGSQFTDEEKQTILNAGFFVIEKYGDSYVLDVPDDFIPKEL